MFYSRVESTAPKIVIRTPPTFLLVLLLGLAAAAEAQTHLATLRGRVLDPGGASVTGATVTLQREAAMTRRQATSGGDGGYVLSQLPPGRYDLDVTVPGYQVHRDSVTIQVNQQIRLDVTLRLGSLSEQVDVSARAEFADADRIGQATVIDNRQISLLPLDSRNVLDLSLLVPGAAPAPAGSASSVRGDFAFSVNGAREDANSFLLDGAYDVDPKLNTVAVTPPVDAIAEFQVLTNGYDASFGRHAGAQVNVVTKNGSNRFDGTVYEFFRHDALNATNAFAPRDQPAPDYERHQFGGALGGPLVRNRSFFFVDYEGRRLSEGITRVSNVPTAAERTGDFSRSALGAPLDPFTGQPFPGGHIPVARLDPVGTAIADVYPLPNRMVPLANYVSSPVLLDEVDHTDIRVDHRLTDASTLMVRYSLEDRRLFEPFAGPGFATVPGFGTNVPRRAQNLLISDTRVLSPTLVSDLRVTFNRVSASALHENQGRNRNADVGLPQLSTDPRDAGLSFITITGLSPLGDEFNNPQQSATNQVQILETLSWARGKHLVKFGADVGFLHQNAFRDVQARGFLNFSSQAPFTGNALADLLVGLPVASGGATLDNPQRLRTERLSLFVQDSVHLTPSLTLSAGVRYELTSPPVDANDRANVYDPTTGSLVPVGTGGVPRAGYASDRNNWAPRIGVAWTPGRSGRTIVRAGYGLFYNQSALAPGEGLYFNPPFFDFSLFFPLPGLPLTLSDPFPSAFPVPLPSSALTFQPDLRTPYLHHWNLGVQQELGDSRSIEMAYVGSLGRNLLNGRDINQATASPSPRNLRPNPAVADVVSLESRARSEYHSLQLTFRQRLRGGLSVLSAYTFGKSMDDASGFFSSSGDPNFPQDSNTPGAEYGRSSFDIRHRWTLSATYELPFGRGRRWASDRGWVSQLLSDWQVAGIVTVQSGQPFTVALPPEFDNSNTGRASLGFGANDRPDLVGDPALASPTAARWFDTTAFALPPFGSFGTAGRNILDGPGFQQVNVALHRRARLGDDLALELRLEAFNLLNHVNLGLPDAFLGSPTFGQVLSAGNPRRLQLGVKLHF